MTDLFVLNDDVHRDGLARKESEFLRLNGGNDLLASSFLFIQGKDINAENIVLQILTCFLKLLIESVKHGDCSIGPEKAMGCNLTLLTAIILDRIHFRHVAGLAS